MAATTAAEAQQAAPKRVALVIGNAAYQQTPLKNPVNDARVMANTLRQLGFQVIQRENATKQQMEQAVGEFGRALTKGGVALFYYAGHGMQVNGRNFLIPTDATIATEQAVRLESLDVDLVLDQVAGSGTDVNLIVLDACRNNPFERRFRSGGSGGLAQINAPKGTMIAYATAPGSVAADGDGANGLYTSKLVEAIKQPGLPVEEVFKRVRANVAQASRDQQTPWEASSLVGNFYFLGPTTVVVNQPAAAAQQQQAAAPAPVPAAAPAASAFDGTWATVVTCDKAQDGAKGYALRFPSHVRNGELAGDFAAANNQASLRLRGTIGPDGKAVIFATGTTGSEEHAVGRAKPGSNYSYTANAR
ncbi:caspase domain-containing protein, partial [Thermomonas sp.]|uniref:caspase family protein n=1 Tax=Thermomonas sp. TaxID=1971895 RepID=UPI0035AE2951